MARARVGFVPHGEEYKAGAADLTRRSARLFIGRRARYTTEVRWLVLGSAAAAMALLAGPIAPAGAAPPVAAPAPTAPAPTAPAHPPPPPTVPPARRPPLTARDVAGAPRPDRARNQVEDDRSGARHLLWVPRALLFVPRWGLWLAASPVRGGLYGFERYGVGPRLRQLLSGNGPISVFPTVAREAGHGLTYGIGGGISHHVRANFLFGGEVRQVYDLRLVTHGLLGPRLDLELGGQIQRLQESQFFGIGNGDLEPAGMTSGVDPRVDATAVETRFDQENVRLELAADWVPLASLPALATHLTGAVFDKDLGSTGGSGLVDIAEVYDPEGLVGFDGGARYVYGEARAIYDDRATTSPFVSLAEPSTGWKLEGFAGYAHGLGTDPSRYLRYGVDLQRHIDLYMGDRVLVLRAYLEGVTADLDEIPFTELPRLGGSRLLRGYARNRFRDRSVTAFSVEYRYPVSRYLGAFAFVDGGGAWRRLGDFDPAALHPGYGAGIQLHTAELFLTRFLVAGGDDGITFYLSFSPSSELKLTTHQW